MPFSNWFHHVAIRGCLIAAFVTAASGLCHGQNPPGNADNASQTEAQKTPAPETERDPFKLGYKGEPGTYRAICAEPKDREQADLCQQWRSAEAAERGVRLNQTQIWIGAFGLAAVAVSLILSAFAAWVAAKSAREAGKSASAADRTANIMDQTAERQLRAYLFLDPKTFDLKPVFSEETGKDRMCLCKIGYLINNTGQTPAYRVKTEADIRTLGWPPPPDLVIEPSPGDVVSQLRGVGAGHPMGGSVSKFIMIDLDAVNALTQRIYFVGVVTYFDVFEEVRHTRFCCSVLGLLDYLKGGLKDTSVLSFEWSQQHNHAD